MLFLAQSMSPVEFGKPGRQVMLAKSCLIRLSLDLVEASYFSNVNPTFSVT
jgi:hypothetical protein